MKKKKCSHIWKMDEIFASGAITMLSGGLSLREEAPYFCEKCGEVRYFEKPGGKEINLLDELDPSKKQEE